MKPQQWASESGIKFHLETQDSNNSSLDTFTALCGFSGVFRHQRNENHTFLRCAECERISSANILDVADQGRSTTELTESITVGDTGVSSASERKPSGEDSGCQVRSLDAHQAADSQSLTYTEGERSKGKVMLSGRLSEISPTSAVDTRREESTESTISKSALTPEVPSRAAQGEGSRPLSLNSSLPVPLGREVSGSTEGRASSAPKTSGNIGDYPTRRCPVNDPLGSEHPISPADQILEVAPRQEQPTKEASHVAGDWSPDLMRPESQLNSSLKAKTGVQSTVTDCTSEYQGTTIENLVATVDKVTLKQRIDFEIRLNRELPSQGDPIHDSNGRW